MYGFHHRSFPSSLHYPVTLFLQQHDTLLRDSGWQDTQICKLFTHVFICVCVRTFIWKSPTCTMTMATSRTAPCAVAAERCCSVETPTAAGTKPNACFSQTRSCPTISYSISHFISLASWHFVTLHFHNRPYTLPLQLFQWRAASFDESFKLVTLIITFQALVKCLNNAVIF